MVPPGLLLVYEALSYYLAGYGMVPPGFEPDDDLPEPLELFQVCLSARERERERARERESERGARECESARESERRGHKCSSMRTLEVEAHMRTRMKAVEV